MTDRSGTTVGGSNCASCGSVNPPTSMFCGTCGHALSKIEGTVDPARTLPPSPSGNSPKRTPTRKRAVPDRQKIRATTTRARKTWRLVRRVSRWGIGALFVGASFATLWGNIDRVPVIRDLNIPAMGDVFGGGGAQDTSGDAVTITTNAEGDDGAPSAPGEPESLVGLIESLEASTGGGTVQNAFDGDRATGWTPCAGCATPFGVGESITVRFSQPVTISEIAIVNGVEGVAGVLPVMSVELTFGGGPSIPLGFQEDVQRWKFNDERLEIETSQLTLTITGVFRVDETAGTTALGEVEFVGVTG